MPDLNDFNAFNSTSGGDGNGGGGHVAEIGTSVAVGLSSLLWRIMLENRRLNIRKSNNRRLDF